MEIDNDAVLRTGKEIEIQASVEKVWEIQTDINAWPKWQPEITNARIAGKLESGESFVWKSGGFKLTSTIDEVSEYSFLGWHGQGFGASAIHVWEFERLDNGNTLVRTNGSMDGWLVRLLKGMMDKKLNESLDVWLDALKKTSEHT